MSESCRSLSIGAHQLADVTIAAVLLSAVGEISQRSFVRLLSRICGVIGTTIISSIGSASPARSRLYLRRLVSVVYELRRLL